MFRISLLQGRPGVTGRYPLGPGLREGDVAPRQAAEAILEPARHTRAGGRRAHVPPRVRSERGLDGDVADPAQVVAVRVDLRHADAVRVLPFLRRLGGDHARLVQPVEERAVVEDVERRRNVLPAHRRPLRRRGRAVGRQIRVVVRRNGRELHVLGRHEGAVVEARLGAGRRLLSVLHPVDERDPQGAHGLGLRVGVRLLLAVAKRRTFRQVRRHLIGRIEARRSVLRAGHDVGARVLRVGQVALA